MNKRILFLYPLFLLFLFWLFISTAYAQKEKKVLILDWDGTTINDAKITDLWITPWILEKVDNLSSTMQLAIDGVRESYGRQDLSRETQSKLESLPRYIEVSQAEKEEIFERMARTDAILGHFDEYTLRPDPFLDRPSSIIPAYYRISNNVSYKFYKTGLNGENYLLRHYQQAKKTSSS